MSTPSTSPHERPTTADDELAFAGLSRLAELLQHGHLTPRELTEFYLRRIEREDVRIVVELWRRPPGELTVRQ